MLASRRGGPASWAPGAGPPVGRGRREGIGWRAGPPGGRGRRERGKWRCWYPQSHLALRRPRLPHPLLRSPKKCRSSSDMATVVFFSVYPKILMISSPVGFFCFVFPTTGIWFEDFFFPFGCLLHTTIPTFTPLGRDTTYRGAAFLSLRSGRLLIFLIWGRKTRISLYNGMRIESKTTH